MTRCLELHLPCVELRQIHLIFQVNDEDGFRQEVEERNLEEAVFVTDQRLEQIRHETSKIPRCKRWWCLSQVVGQMINCRPPLNTQVLASQNCPRKMVSDELFRQNGLSRKKNDYFPLYENWDDSSSPLLPPWNPVHNKYSHRQHDLAKNDCGLDRSSTKVRHLSAKQTCSAQRAYDDWSSSSLTLANCC